MSTAPPYPFAADPFEPDMSAFEEISTAPPVKPATAAERSGNALRPLSFFDILGQERAKKLLQRMVNVAKSRDGRLDHTLFVGPAGTGKTTFAHVIANELGVEVFQLEAPVSADTLMGLRTAMKDGDILLIDEIHQQAVGDRRGRQSSTQPEVLFSVMEDFTLPTAHGVLAFPRITVIGATTDEGALPDPFVMRFPIRPVFEEYSENDLAVMAMRNAAKLRLQCSSAVALRFARASRRVPREINNYVKNAASLTTGVITDELASEVLHDLCRVTDDGLTYDMQSLLVFLFTRCRREVHAAGEVRYQASVSTIATAIGKSRDQKAVQLRVEPWLIREGYLQVLHGGRALTPAGVHRAKELLDAH